MYFKVNIVLIRNFKNHPKHNFLGVSRRAAGVSKKGGYWIYPFQYLTRGMAYVIFPLTSIHSKSTDFALTWLTFSDSKKILSKVSLKLQNVGSQT